MKKYIVTACSFWIVILLASTLSASRIDEYLTDSQYVITSDMNSSETAAVNSNLWNSSDTAWTTAASLSTDQDTSGYDINRFALYVENSFTTQPTASTQTSSSRKGSSPEPITMLLFGTCLTALATFERRRKQK